MFRRGIPVSVQQRNRLLNALAVAGNTASPVAPVSLQTLADHLGSSLSGLNLMPQQRQQLAIDLNMLLYSNELAPSDTQIVIDDARNVLQKAGVNAQAIDILTTDFISINRDLQAGGAATTSAPAQTKP
jgi:hypothetical protein